ncbi:5'-nucleotidase C-terminal domain-containing protein [Sulfitobacter sp. S223]|uniref:5'-nucleotidase C-terminal domain-containing protein n=1 Tax=Sulfitobacter sp. S223 TaxID=2867023 RepID=UPI0021A75CBB|nr:5'-nucleotidase C-terminal domain-containing protein [Sulfitobacter sp. S223]UWR26794.1 5'-nucleotidase C-terminal domain-containing protein [Sulfitobacter sp. S223]
MAAPFISSQQSPTRPAAQIRLLATTDLHGHLLPYDYIKDQPTQGGGLAGLATLIAEARAQAKAKGIPVALVDNGDTFQGTPLASYLVAEDVRPDHPIVAALNYLDYDAVGLGNHDLDHGLPYLKAIARALKMPILSSNLHGNDIHPLQQSLLLPMDIGPNAPAPLTLGMLSVLPEQSVAWQSHHLSDQTTLEPLSATIRNAAAALRQSGADLIVMLAHLGVGDPDSPELSERAAHVVVQAGFVDAMVLGHTHRRFPSSDYADRKGVDLCKSMIGDIPTVMPGHAGSDLGIIDLDLSYDAISGWQVVEHQCVLLSNTGHNPPAPSETIKALTATKHAEVRAALNVPVASTGENLHSFFSLVAPASTQLLVARAQHRLVSEMIAGTQDESTPVLSAVAAHSAGGRDGPENYVFIPEGEVLKRHIAGMNHFANQTVAIRITGAELKNWLEHSVLFFNALQPNQPMQMLINPEIPGFQFDTIFGLHIRIDPTAPKHTRITEMNFDDVPVEPQQEFILATNQFRVAGGGGYPLTNPDRIVAASDRALQDAIIGVLRSSAPHPYAGQPPWRFAPQNGVETSFLTHPDAQNYLEEIADLKPQVLGTTPQGFLSLSITL